MDNGIEKAWAQGVIPLSLLPEKKERQRFKLTFGFTLSVIVALGALAGVLAIGLLFYEAVQQGNGALAVDIDKLALASTLQQLTSLSLIPREALAIMTAFLVGEQVQNPEFLSLQNDQLRRLLFAASLGTFDGVFLAFPDGTLTGYVGPMVAPFVYVNSSKGLNGTTSLHVFSANNSLGTPTQLMANISNFDARSFNWFQSAVRQPRMPLGQVTWTDTELLAYCDCLGITASKPVRRSSRLIAVIGNTLRLASLSLALNTSAIGKTGQAFLIDRNGNLAALSDPARLNFSFAAQLTSATLVDDPVFRDMIAYLLSQSGGRFDSVPTIAPKFVTFAGVSHLFATTRVAPATGLNWTAVVIIPRSDYFAVSDNAATGALIAGILTGVGVVVITILTTMLLLTRPLLRLARSMNTTAISFEVPLVPRKRSFIHEVASIEEAYANLAHGVYSFGKYVPRPVVKALIQDSKKPQVNVQSRECTFFFSDIVGFTSMAEAVSEVVLNMIIAEYFAEMETILFGLEGITTDFLGDGLFVFWNAPLLRPDHACLACEAALRQQERLAELRRSWSEKGLPELSIRIGINTGPCLVGSFGSDNHLKYTVIGDAVNVASRLEQLNKRYQTGTIVGPTTYENVKDDFIMRPLDVVLLKGKGEPTKVYELLCRRRDAPPQILLLAEQSTKMLSCYVTADFSACSFWAQEILASFPLDVPAKIMLEECGKLCQDVPVEWTPVRKLSEK